MVTEVKGWNDARKGSGAKECTRPPGYKRSKETASPMEPPSGASPANTLTGAR